MFAILFEVLLIEFQEEIHHFAGWEGGVKGHKNCQQRFCEQTGISYLRRKREKRKTNGKAKKKKAWENSSDPIYTNLIKNFPTLVSRGRCGRENRAAAATCGCGRCERPAILRLTPEIASGYRSFAAGEAQNLAISTAEWLLASPLAATVEIFVPQAPKTRIKIGENR